MEKFQTCRENKLQNAFESIIQKHKQNFGKDFAIRWLEANPQENLVVALLRKELKRQVELVQELSRQIKEHQL
ncbi:hypothetical protein [Raineya sp.]|jgi:hypothetical protein